MTDERRKKFTGSKPDNYDRLCEFSHPPPTLPLHFFPFYSFICLFIYLFNHLFLFYYYLLFFFFVFFIYLSPLHSLFHHLLISSISFCLLLLPFSSHHLQPIHPLRFSFSPPPPRPQCLGQQLQTTACRRQIHLHLRQLRDMRGDRKVEFN